jgi:hypothetical protein
VKTNPAPSSPTRLGLFYFQKMSGWIKVHRQLTNHWIWDKPEYLKWWMDILMQANIEPKKVLIKGQLIQVQRGEVIYSYETWANRWKINKSKVLRFLKMLEKDSMIELKSETVTTRLTICKYDTYQGERNDSETQVKRTRNASETQVKPTKEVKELNKEISKETFLSLVEIEAEMAKEKPLKRPYFKRMQEIYTLDEKTINEEFRKWSTLKEGEAMTIDKAQNSFNLYLQNKTKNNAYSEGGKVEPPKYAKSTLEDNWW